MNFRFRKEAERELSESASWYESQNPGLGQRFLDQIQIALAGIAERPLLYSQLRPNIRRCSLRRFPFGILYKIEGEMVVVVAVIHGKRNPGRWKNR